MYYYGDALAHRSDGYKQDVQGLRFRFPLPQLPEESAKARLHLTILCIAVPCTTMIAYENGAYIPLLFST